MAKPNISMEFNYEQIQTRVSRAVADGIDKLRECNIDGENILEIYIDSKEIDKKKNKITYPMLYVSDRKDTDQNTIVPRFRYVEAVHKEVINKWNKILPDNFFEQYESYVFGRCNESGWENGFLYHNFIVRAGNYENMLIVNPPPTFVRKCKGCKKKISFAFSSYNYYYAYNLDKTIGSEVRRIYDLPPGAYQRALYFGSNLSQAELIHMLEHVRNGLAVGRQTNLYLVVSAKHLENRNSEPELWNYLNKYFTIFKIVLIDSKVVQNNPKKRAVLILQNEPQNDNAEIFVQKTRLINNHTFGTLEFRHIAYESFQNRDRTLSEMYDTDYIDYAKSNRRKKPLEYKFSTEISIWVSFASNKKGNIRPTYGIYDYPTNEQLRKNTLPRGKALKSKIPGKWYGSQDEAIKSTEKLLMHDADAAKKMRKATMKKYESLPIAVKTMLFLRWEDMFSQKAFDKNLCEEVFGSPNSAEERICAMIVGKADSVEIKSIVESYVAEHKFSASKTDRLWKQLELIFDYAVIDKRCIHNPVRSLINVRDTSKKDKLDMRRALINSSFSAENEKKLIAYLLSDKMHSDLAIMQLVRYYSGLSINELRALKCEDFRYDEKLDLGQLAVTKEMPYRSDEIQLIMPENRRRFIPLPTFVTDLLRTNLCLRKHGTQTPLFANPKGKNKPITAKQVYAYINNIFENVLNLQEYIIPIIDEDSVSESDINHYGGDIVRSNFMYWAKEKALMEPEETDFLMGRKLRTTESQYYCDYNNPYIQLIMRVKIDRWAGNPLENEPKKKIHSNILNGGEETTIITNTHEKRSELCIELSAENDEDACIDLQVFARFGGKIQIEYYECEEA